MKPKWTFEELREKLGQGPRKPVPELIMIIMKQNKGKRQEYNDIIMGIIEYCAENGFCLPRINTVERQLRKLSEKRVLRSDRGGYFWERPKDDKSAKLDRFFGEKQ